MTYSFEGKDAALYADMLALLQRGEGRTVYDSANALLLLCGEDEYLLSAESVEEGEKLIRQVAADPMNFLVLRSADERVAQALFKIAQECGFNGTSQCWQAIYEGERRPERQRLSFRAPADADFAKVRGTYLHEGDAEFWRDYHSGEFFTAYDGDTFVGYIGIHKDGSMGLLHVFSEFRGKGYGSELASMLINYQLDRKRIPYGQIVVGNTASIEMNKSIGFRLSTTTLYWLWQERPMEWDVNSTEETEAVGALIARLSRPGEVYALDGDLGAGKTAWVRGFARGLGADPTKVASPTFTIVHEYRDGHVPIFHFDVYRLPDEDALYDIGWDDYLDQPGVTLVEWASQLKGAMPDHTQWIRITKDLSKGTDYRHIVFQS